MKCAIPLQCLLPENALQGSKWEQQYPFTWLTYALVRSFLRILKETFWTWGCDECGLYKPLLLRDCSHCSHTGLQNLNDFLLKSLSTYRNHASANCMQFTISNCSVSQNVPTVTHLLIVVVQSVERRDIAFTYYTTFFFTFLQHDSLHRNSAKHPFLSCRHCLFLRCGK